MSEPSINSFAIFFARLAWMIFGPLALFLCLSAVGRSGGEWFGVADSVFFGVVAAMIACRFYEFRTGQALTASGDPMTASVLSRYALALGLICLAVWVGVKLFTQGML